ncbi:MAG: flagellar hook-associated protein 3 [Deltaproteobacteria bacterium]|nr:MAG: flagellar hook-associated protein 3 [Deltaproteobacteria bacterium]
MLRVTDEMMLSAALYNLRRNSRKLFRLQVMAASGKRILAPSDDPLGAIKVIDYNSQLSRFEQYQRNIAFGLSWLQRTEGVLQDLEELVSRAHEIAVSQSSGTADAQSRASCAGIVREIKAQVWQLSNASLGGRYLFAGLKNDQPPYAEDGSYQGDTGEFQISVGQGVRVAVNLVGPEVFSFGSTDLFQELEELAQALENDQPDLIAQKLDTLDQALRQLINARAKVGARVERLESYKGVLEGSALKVKERLSEIEDADIAEVITELATREAVYQASLLATRRLLEENLVSLMG